MRKIIQIAAPSNDVFLALCDDGTVWLNGSSSQWIEMPKIPQIETLEEE